jgi:hypothetical protein
MISSSQLCMQILCYKVYQCNFWKDFLGSLIYTIILAENRKLTISFFPNCIPLISFSCLIAWARTSNTIWKRHRGRDCLFFFFFTFKKYFYWVFSSFTFPMLSQKSPIPPPPLPYPPTPTFWPWRSPVLGHIKFAGPMGLSFQWWPATWAKSFSSLAVNFFRLFISLSPCNKFETNWLDLEWPSQLEATAS